VGRVDRDSVIFEKNLSTVLIALWCRPNGGASAPGVSR
jgi:hypothetical protein